MKQPEDTSIRSLLAQQIGAEVKLGMTLANDPLNANLPDLNLRVTTLDSAWFRRTCLVCKDKFREGDQVLLCPKCNAPYHNDKQYNLYCWQKHFTNGAICNEGGIDDFGEQIREIPRCDFSWSAPLSLNTSLTGALPYTEPAPPQTFSDQLLVRQFVSGVEATWRPFGELQSLRITPNSPYVGRNCPWCRLRIRAGDLAVACPCPRNCGTFFHQDIFHHLTCWNEWNGKTGHDYCPNTFTPYPESLKGSQDDF